MEFAKLSEDELKAFIGKNADYYIKRFKKFEKGGSLSWNWYAFLFGVLWMFYRKMYLYGFSALAVIFSINLFISILKIDQVISTGISLWLWIGFGMFGNYLYYLHVKNSISKIKKSTYHSDVILTISKKGGVNKFVLYFFSGITIVYFLFLTLSIFLIKN